MFRVPESEVGEKVMRHVVRPAVITSGHKGVNDEKQQQEPEEDPVKVLFQAVGHGILKLIGANV